MVITFHRAILTVLILVIGLSQYAGFELYTTNYNRSFFPEEYYFWGVITTSVFFFCIWFLGLVIHSLFNRIIIPLREIKSNRKKRAKWLRKMLTGFRLAFVAPGLYIFFLVAASLAPGCLLALSLSLLF